MPQTSGQSDVISPSAAIVREVQAWIDHPSWDESLPREKDHDVQKCIALLQAQRVNESESPTPTTSRFCFERYVGAGGFGVVLAVHDEQTARLMAIKVQRPSINHQQFARRRFQREAQVAESLDHPGIVRVVEVGEFQESPWILMPLIDGPNLGQHLRDCGGRLPIAESVELIRQVAEALQFAHDRAVLHRDLKPSNILLAPVAADATSSCRWRPMLSDFGLAKQLDVPADSGQNLSAGVQFLGTLRYTSPEQASGRLQDVGVASDGYSMGVILYQCVTGEMPHSGSNHAAVLHKILYEPATPPSRLRPECSGDLDNILLKCLSREPRDRYASAGEFAAELGRFQRGEPLVARRASVYRQLRHWARHNRLTATLSAVIAIGFPVALIITSSLYFRAKNSAAVAEQTMQAISSLYVSVTEDVLKEIPDSTKHQVTMHRRALQALEKLRSTIGDTPAMRYQLSVQHSHLGTKM